MSTSRGLCGTTDKRFELDSRAELWRELLPWRIELQGWAESTTWQTVDYKRAHGINHENVTAFAGIIAMANVEFIGCGRFTFPALGGEPAAVIEVVEYDADNDPVTVDLVAWSSHEPDLFGTVTGAGMALGLFNVTNPATYYAGKLLKAHRTPLAWLQAGCMGACVLEPEATATALGRALGPILAEDEEHARKLRTGLQGLALPPRVAFPATARQRAAA